MFLEEVILAIQRARHLHFIYFLQKIFHFQYHNTHIDCLFIVASLSAWDCESPNQNVNTASAFISDY